MESAQISEKSPGSRDVRRLGLLSDTHGRAGPAREAARLLVAAGAEMLLHLGDIGGPEVLDVLAAAGIPARAVLGNVDLDAARLARRARRLGIVLEPRLGRIDAAGKTVLFLHGHIPGLLEEALAEGPDFLLHGHTHRLRDETIGPTRIINPGALHRARVRTAALLDLPSGRLEIVTVPVSPEGSPAPRPAPSAPPPGRRGGRWRRPPGG